MLEHSFPREPLQRTDTDRAKIDQDKRNQTVNVTASLRPLVGEHDMRG